MRRENRQENRKQPGLLQRLRQWINPGPANREQLIGVLRDARQRALMEGDALAMIEGVLQVSEMRVKDIMIPRAHMKAIERDAPLRKILPIVIESAHSRFPVIGDDRGEVVGILLAKDLLAFCGSKNASRFDLRELLRTAVFVPESKRLNVLLNEFKDNRNHMAIVVDEFGVAAGLVTIEDVLEQIVGEIEDESGFGEGASILQSSATEYTVKAQTEIADFNTYFNSTLPDDEFDTIAGLVASSLGHLPRRGESLEIDRFRFTILRADSRRIHLLKVTLRLSTEGTATE